MPPRRQADDAAGDERRDEEGERRGDPPAEEQSEEKQDASACQQTDPGVAPPAGPTVLRRGRDGGALRRGRLYRWQGILLLAIYAAFCLFQFFL